MIKGLIITHGNLGAELVKVSEKILQKDSDIEFIGFEWDENGSKVINVIDQFIKKNKNNKIIIFTDMFGGSPTNICFKFKNPNIEIITGINLPGLLKFLTYKDKKMPLKEIVSTIKKGAIDGINIVKEYLGERNHD